MTRRKGVHRRLRISGVELGDDHRRALPLLFIALTFPMRTAVLTPLGTPPPGGDAVGKASKRPDRPRPSGNSNERKLKARRTQRQNFALNLSAKRRLCHTVGRRRSIGGAARCCAVSTARSRAAATTNLARSNHSLALRVLVGEAKSSALVNIFMICPRWSAGDSPTPTKLRPRSRLSHGVFIRT
jgi:hypothetical protein